MSLELKGSIKGSIRNYEAHADKTNDGKTANVTFEIPLDEAQASALGGDEFRRACFAGYVGKSSERVYDSVNIGGHLAIKAEHTVKIDGISLSAKPQLGKCKLGDGRIVSLRIKMAVPGSAKTLRRHLDQSAGDDAELVFEGATQTDIEEAASTKRRAKKGAAAEGNGHDAEDAAGAEA